MYSKRPNENGQKSLYQSRNGFIADDLVRAGREELHHHADDVPGSAELAVGPSGGELGEQVLVHVPADVRSRQAGGVEGVRLVHNLTELLGRGDHEDGVAHVLGVGAVRAGAQGLQKGKNAVLDDVEHLCGGQVPEDRPHVLSPLPAENAGIGQVQHDGLLGPGVVQSVQVVDEHEVGDLLDDGQRVGQPIGPEGLPERVDLVFQFAGAHSWPRLSQFVEFKKL